MATHESQRPIDGRALLAELVKGNTDWIRSAGNLPVALDNADEALFVDTGSIDIYMCNIDNGVAQSSFLHIVRIEANHLAFNWCGVSNDTGMRLIAKGMPGSGARRVPLSLLIEADSQSEAGRAITAAVADDVEDWVGALSHRVADRITLRPAAKLMLEPGESGEADGAVYSRKGVAWVHTETPASFLSTEDIEGTLVPVTPYSWLDLGGRQKISSRTSHSLPIETLLRQAIQDFHRLLFSAEELNRRLLSADLGNLQVEQSAHMMAENVKARNRLFNIFELWKPSVTGGGALMAALCAVGDYENITIRKPDNEEDASRLHNILATSGVRARLVALTLQDRWWLQDCGALLAFRRETREPLALLPGLTGRYRAFDPATGKTLRVERALAENLEPNAWYLYQPLPDNRPCTLKDLFSLTKGNITTGIIRICLAGLLSAIFMMTPAIALGILLNQIYPSGDESALFAFTATLLLFGLLAALTQVLRGTALMRLEARFAGRMTAALWDRLLRFRADFFRNHTTGELCIRADIFQSLRNRISGVVAASLLSTLFLLPALGILFLYDAKLGWLTVGVGMVVLVVAAVLGVSQIDRHRNYYLETAALFGHLSQLIRGISKLQTAGAELLAQASWANYYYKLKRQEIRIAVINEHLTAFSSAVPALGGAALIGLTLVEGVEGVSIADFLVVYAASMIFYTSISAFGASFEIAASIVPACEQVAPILSGQPDTGSHRGETITCLGELHLDRLTFRYNPDGPMVLNDVSIHAGPGEFIAIVGESGAGKSTMIRLALGLEDPESGAVYFDGRDLAHLDRPSIRRQVGVVVQNGPLRPGTVLDNIIGVSSDLTIEDAWLAARIAEIEQDIQAMPMGMYTPVSERTAAFSGGQIQRLQIAAAMVHNPRILFLDEPTNWLDSKSQSRVMANLQKTSTTRIVIAHRLSTIQRADCIYVISAGRVVQKGLFEELAYVDGPFRKLAQRQMA